MQTHTCRSATGAWHPEFAIEAALLGSFMVSAIAFTVLVEHPDSPVRMALESPLLRRLAIGAGMGATALVLIESAWGQRSGAHMNPAVTLAFARLGLITPATAAGYIAAQFAGGAAGVAVAWLLFGATVPHASVNYAVTLPAAGPAAAFAAELIMTWLLLSIVLAASRKKRWRGHGAVLSALCIWAFITFAAPVSGMSLNPARSVASAVWAGEFSGLWIYFVAPVLGMQLAAARASILHLAKDPA